MIRRIQATRRFVEARVPRLIQVRPTSPDPPFDGNLLSFVGLISDSFRTDRTGRRTRNQQSGPHPPRIRRLADLQNP